ncbi:MAG: Nif3-like dinuclear metal center hexameric protein [Bacilli bacterium]|jgi:dinuclear metal center YbgI/SA1388 family protein|nr:Nif3-like dinuclear metal center hexameric protein [Bacilli bacterium]HHU24565.1 Nif3-like dinuclear metal center hexameric protein [Acholeplasmataceae bacterium]
MEVKELLEYLLKLFPLDLAMDFDHGKLGLQIGSINNPIKKVILTLDVTEEVIEEANQKGANVIISHHPFIFEPLLQINYDSPLGKKIKKLITNDLNVINLHTNLDVASGGMNDFLAQRLGLKDIEPADIISSNQVLRTGLIEPIALELFVKSVQKAFNEEVVRYAGNPNQVITKVGIVGGSGSTEISEALALGCDCFITGEIKHHSALLSKETNISLIEVSHSVEALYLNHLKEKLNKAFPDLTIETTETTVNPFRFIYPK